MDRTDRLINNRAPRKLLLILLLMICISAAAAWGISKLCADRIVREQITAELSAIGDGKFTGAPDEKAIARAEEKLSGYSIDRELSPTIMYSYKSVRTTIFTAIFAVMASLSVIWFAIAIHELMNIYRDLEKLRADCLNAADKTDGTIGLYGEDLGCVRRISEAADTLTDRMNNLHFKLNNEQRFLRDFLTDLSHQIKTSLAVVRLNTDMLSELDDLPQEHRDKLSDEIQLNLSSMEKLVIEAIKLAKLNADAVEYNMEINSPAEICRIAVKRMSPLLRSKSIKVNESLADDIKLSCDKGWLCEALENIIKNSADHSECSEISLELKDDPIMITLAVTDNGKGIPQEEIPKLFERFSCRSNDKTMYSSGLGMSIAQKIVRANGGDIMVYSEVGKGTRFEFVFIKD
ncbi:sensor histidine kinase KdpD [Ruminococcus sp.]|uniref:sensor histidine kinase n=1 Tax=Ruminococcus sp. TaxID=41978 RepID=UPI0025FA845D|nr:HAMP domain-containing sensor histidine kinase [Ruminococcus sp.]